MSNNFDLSLLKKLNLSTTKLLLLLIYCVFIFNASSQQRPYDKVPRRVRLNQEKLSNWVTLKANTDSDKVYAIYYWITHNIRYDIKKAVRYDYNNVSTKKILKKRKAICTGFSQLFDEMCRTVGIPCVEVPGYTKTLLNKDACDTFYLDDHIWNAVYIDGRWSMLDATWDAGYIKTAHITVGSFLMHYLSLKKKFIMRPCRIFKQRPTTNYYLKSGAYFSYDHLPSNPQWHLSDTYLPTINFQNDSSFYYQKNKLDNPAGDEMTSYREEYMTKSRLEQMKDDGYASFELNSRNHFGYAISSYINSTKNIIKLREIYNTGDKVEFLHTFDSLALHANRAILHCDTNKILLIEQKTQLSKNVLKKNNMMQSQNRQLIANSRKTIALKVKIKSTKKLFKELYKSSFKTTSEKIADLRKDDGIYTSKPPKNPATVDSLLLIAEIKSTDSLILLKKEELKTTKQKADSFINYIILKLDSNFQFNIQKYNNSWAALNTRIYGIDNYDYYIRKLKDSLVILDQLHAMDFTVANRNVFDSLMSGLRLCRFQANNLHGLYYQKSRIYKKLKTKSYTNSNDVINLYVQNINLAITEINEYYSWLSGNENFFSAITPPIRKLAKMCNKTIRWLEFEKSFKQNSDIINSEQRALTSLSDSYRRDANKQLTEANKLKSKLLGLK